MHLLLRSSVAERSVTMLSQRNNDRLPLRLGSDNIPRRADEGAQVGACAAHPAYAQVAKSCHVPIRKPSYQIERND
jgi:hypothetical protein